MNSAVHVGRYDQRINELMKENVDHLGSLYARSLLTSTVLFSFLNLSAIHLTQGVLLENLNKLKKPLRDSFISQTTLRAFALALIWSPMEIIVALTVDSTGVSYLAYLPWLLLCSAIVLSIDLLRGKKRYEHIPYTASTETGRKKIKKTDYFHPNF